MNDKQPKTAQKIFSILMISVLLTLAWFATPAPAEAMSIPPWNLWFYYGVDDDRSELATSSKDNEVRSGKVLNFDWYDRWSDHTFTVTTYSGPYSTSTTSYFARKDAGLSAFTSLEGVSRVSVATENGTTFWFVVNSNFVDTTIHPPYWNWEFKYKVEDPANWKRLPWQSTSTARYNPISIGTLYFSWYGNGDKTHIKVTRYDNVFNVIDVEEYDDPYGHIYYNETDITATVSWVKVEFLGLTYWFGK